MIQVAASDQRKRRPGGRTANVTARVNEAVLNLLVEGGEQACTFKAIAERAGVERSTLHRRFSDRWELIIEAFVAKGQAETLPDDTGNFAEDLKSVLTKLARFLESSLGPAMVAAAASFRARSGTDYSRVFFDLRMAQLQPMFDAAIARHELSPDVDREELFTLAAGPIYFRMFIAARGVDAEFIQAIVSKVCWLYCAPSAAAKLSLPARIA